MNSVIFRRLRKWSQYTLIAMGILAMPYVIQKGIIYGKYHAEKRVSRQNADTAALKSQVEKELEMLEKKLAAKTPRSFYLVINSSANDFTLYKGETVIRKGKCSTGSYVLLRNGAEQHWMFKTPTGEFRIRGKRISPVWKKPDWAFVEAGKPVPSPDHHSRFEYGVLGDYAMDLGDGYLIHGTLFQRFIGLPVTHGCIRMLDEDLTLVFHSLTTGSKVYIF